MQWIVISDYIAFISNGIGGISPTIGYSICVFIAHSTGMYTLLGETISHSAWSYHFCISCDSLLTILLVIIRRKMVEGGTLMNRLLEAKDNNRCMDYRFFQESLFVLKGKLPVI